MKRSLVAIIILATTALVVAWNSGYDLKRKPPTPLPVAYEAALKALGPATNQLHCVGAFLDGAEPGGDWVIRFYSTNATDRLNVERYVTVGFKGEVYVQDSYER